MGILVLLFLLALAVYLFGPNSPIDWGRSSKEELEIHEEIVEEWNATLDKSDRGEL